MAKRPRFTTPKGKLGFPCSIHIPDTKFSDAKDPNDRGEYKARIILPLSEASTQEFLSSLQSQFDEHVEETKRTLKKKKFNISDDNIPWAMEEDEETGEETGNVIIRTKLKARVVSKDGESFFDQRPKVFTPSGEVLTGEDIPAIGPGSTVKLAGQVNLWANAAKGPGMSLWMTAVQLFDLVERGGSNDAEDYGFAVEEDSEALANAEAEGSDGDY